MFRELIGKTVFSIEPQNEPMFMGKDISEVVINNNPALKQWSCKLAQLIKTFLN
eukprot:Pgem_evm1s4344